MNIKRFNDFINESTEDEFMGFIKNLVNDIKILEPKEYIDILKENKEIIYEFYEKFKEEPRSMVIYINSEINRLLRIFPVREVVEEFSKKDSLKSILDKYEEHRKKMPDRMKKGMFGLY